jgi:hypothetical protein
MGYAHLIQTTANRSGLPFLATKFDEFVTKLFVGIFGQTIVDTGKFFAEKTLLSTVAAEGASSNFMFRSILLSKAEASKKRSHSSKLRHDALMHLEVREPHAAEDMYGVVGLLGRDRSLVWISLSS